PFPDERRNQFADTMTLTQGSHTLKWGGDINFVTDIISNLRFSGGEFNYTGGTNAAGFYGGLNDFIIDYTNFISPGSLPANTPCYSSTRTVGKCYGGNFNQGLGALGLTMKTTDHNALINTGVGADVAQRQVTLQATSAAAPSYPNLLTTGALVAPAVQYFASNFQLPLIHQTDLVFERQIAHNTAVSVSYLGSFG